MPLKEYGILKSQPIAHVEGRGTAHLEIHTVDDEKHYRIAVNVRSQTFPPELRYIIIDDFQHEITNKLEALDLGYTSTDSKPGGLALDYIRSNIFDYHDMKIAGHIVGQDNDLLEEIEKYVDRAIKTKNAYIYAFGEKWGPEKKRDDYFGFKPGGGIHDIHMNQGNSGKFLDDNGIYQDGGLLIHFPDEEKWVAIFLAFQSQTFHTDDISGNPVDRSIMPEENTVVIVAALLNPILGAKTVSLLNTTSESMSLKDWKLVDKNKNKITIDGDIEAGGFITIPISEDGFEICKDGGLITLLNENGMKIHGVSYTNKDYIYAGKTKKF